MIRRTSAAVKLAACMSRSKVTSTAETVVFSTRFSPLVGAIAPPGPTALVPTTCGPGTIRGSVVGSKGVWKGTPLPTLFAVETTGRGVA